MCAGKDLWTLSFAVPMWITHHKTSPGEERSALAVEDDTPGAPSGVGFADR